MKHAFIMDPLASVKPWKDTTYYLMLAAQQRGHEVYFLQQQDLILQHEQLFATLTFVQVHADHKQPFTIGDVARTTMNDMDVVWLRTDPPFDRRYFYTTLFLDRLAPHVRVVNKPQGVRDWNEKLSALDFPAFTPTTLVSRDINEICQFATQQKRITIKPVDGFGGKGIFFYSPGDDIALINQATHDGSHWVIAQEYLPEAKNGDKRILLVDGEPIGAILRVHAEGVELNNLDAGGTAMATEISKAEWHICEELKPALEDKGAYFVGIDIIGDKLIEINVTSPTGLQELCRFSGVDHHHNIIAGLEA